jgi:hypothetical protein
MLTEVQENVESLVDLSEDGPLVVDTVVNYIYTGEYALRPINPTEASTSARTKKGKNHSTMRTTLATYIADQEALVKDHVAVYVFAEKHNMGALKGSVLARLVELTTIHGFCFDGETMSRIYECTQGPEDALRCFITMESIERHYTGILGQGLANIVAKNESMAWKVAGRLRAQQNRPMSSTEPERPIEFVNVRHSERKNPTNWRIVNANS